MLKSNLLDMLFIKRKKCNSMNATLPIPIRCGTAISSQVSNETYRKADKPLVCKKKSHAPLNTSVRLRRATHPAMWR
ncbi:hypothetical protein [Hydrogenimonas thermophila]|uniref:hypothetical protein n=1 Tax=Hydrogenimonas thermophila TaxID=223786 RepID=UPI000B87B8E2|nr:hypothetical protein [Hydrogenimonas thermophila]WOE70779.1 hypothetical protein RZR91_04220 [Hydrogenimonas thermophila]WOE73297.1 hypothetical protein RZR97_04200 [Hydrogenimonas thermophila]